MINNKFSSKFLNYNKHVLYEFLNLVLIKEYFTNEIKVFINKFVKNP